MNQKLKEWRISEGFSQAQLGRELGVSTASVHHWETGNRAISLPMIRKWLEVFQLDPTKKFEIPMKKSRWDTKEQKENENGNEI